MRNTAKCRFSNSRRSFKLEATIQSTHHRVYNYFTIFGARRRSEVTGFAPLNWIQLIVCPELFVQRGVLVL